MANVGFSTISVIPSTRGFSSALSKQVNPQMTSAGTAGGKRLGSGILASARRFVAPVAALFAVGAGVAFFKAAVSGASDLAESASKVKVVFGEQSAAIMWASKTSATAMGLSKASYLEATGALGNLFVSLKLQPKAAAEMSQGMVTLAADMASFNNVPIEDALLAIRSGLTGETEPLKRFGVNMNEATLKAQAMEMGLINTTKNALTPQTKALAAQALIMAQTGTAQGDFARISDGLANQQKILAARTEDLKTKIGGFLLPAVTKFTSFLSEKVVPAVDDFIGGFEKGTGAGGKFRDILVFIRDKVLVPLANFVTETVLPAVKRISTWITDNGVPKLKEFSDWVIKSRDSLEVLSVFIATALIPVFIRMGVTAVASAAMQAASWATTAASGVASAATQLAAHYVVVAGWVRSSAAAIASGAITVAIWWMLSSSAIAGAARSAGALAIVGAAWVVTAAQATAAGIAMAAAWIIGLGPVAWVIAGVTAVIAVIVLAYFKIGWFRDFVDKAWQGIKAVIGAVVSWFMKTVWPTIKIVIDLIVAGFTAFKKNVQAKWDAFMGIFSKVWEKFLAVGTAIVDGIWSGFKTNWGPFASFVATAVAGLVSGLPKATGESFAGLDLSSVKSGRVAGTGFIDGMTVSVEQGRHALGLVVAQTVAGTGTWDAKTAALAQDAGLHLGSSLGAGIASGIKTTTVPVAKAVSDLASKAADAAKSAVDAWLTQLKTRLDKARSMALDWRSKMIGLLSLSNAFSLASDSKAMAADALKQLTQTQTSLQNAQADFAAESASQSMQAAVKSATARVEAELAAEANARKLAAIIDPLDQSKQRAQDMADVGIAADAAARLAAVAGAVADPLANAKAQVAAAQEAVASAQSVYQAAAADAAISWVDKFRTQMALSTNFMGLLLQLKASGAHQVLIDQIAAAGPEAGTAMAHDLINGGAAGTGGLIDQFNTGFVDFDLSATALGVEFANTWAQAVGPPMGGLTAQKMVNRFEKMLTGDGVGRKKLNRIMDALRDDLARTIELTVNMSGSAVSAVRGLAHGGPVRAGELVVVGEQGPEFFKSKVAGNIIPNGSLDMAAPAIRKAAVNAAGGGATSADIAALGDRIAVELARQARLIQQLQRQGA